MIRRTICLMVMALVLGGAARGEPATQAGRAQLADERRAIAVLARPDLQAGLAPLEHVWKSGSPADLLPATLQRAHAAAEELAFLAATEAVDSDPRRPHVVEVSAAPHDWYGTAVPGGRVGIDNPDTLYFVAPVEAASSYVITGQRGQPGPIDSNFSLMDRNLTHTIANISHSQLRVAPDGRYRITLDATPAAGRPNHIQITPDAGFMFIRNTTADWNKEQVDAIDIDRIAGPPPGPALDDKALVVRAQTLIQAFIKPWLDTYQPGIYAAPLNVMPQPGRPGDKAGFLVTQRNALGHFRLADDQALVLTLNPGGARYVTVPVSDVWGVTPAYWAHQSSLNSSQAQHNPDGTITLVVSAWDPGVANWVDTAGLPEGFIMLRWQGLSAAPSATGEPAVKTTLVTRATLNAALPASMIRMQPAGRNAQLAARAAGFHRRFADRFQP